MLTLIINGFTIGLSTGIYCLIHCAPVFLSFLFLNKPTTESSFKTLLKNNFSILFSFCIGRFIAYATFGAFIGFLGTIVTDNLFTKSIISISYFVIALMLLWFIFYPSEKKHYCSLSRFKQTSSAFLIGILTGINLCPPFILATLSAFEMNSSLDGAIYFSSFYFGTIIYVLPFGFIKIPSILQKIAKLAALIVALIFIVLSIRNLIALVTHPNTDIPTQQIANKEDNSELTRFLDQVHAKNLSLREAAYYQKLSDNNIQCSLCPHRCLLSSGQRGICKVRINVNGNLKTLVYGKPIALHMDPIEKKPLYHFLPNSYAYSIATAGCNLNCVFCQNWQISQSLPEKSIHYNLSPKEVVAAAIAKGAKSIAYTYTEPTIYYEYMLETAKIAKQKNIKNVWITCGYINSEPLDELCTYLDAANVDLKGFSEQFYQTYTSGRLQPVLDTLKTLKKHRISTEITNLIIPGANDNPLMIKNMCEWIIDHLGTDTPLHFSRFFPHYKLTNTPPTPLNTLLEAAAIAKEAGLKYVYIGNTNIKNGGTTFCPSCHKILVERMGYQINQNNIKNNKCKFCYTTIYGVWKNNTSE